MEIPFTKEQFFDVFARYNVSVWPMQFILVIFAISVIVLLFRPLPVRDRLISAVLSFFWIWMAVSYHFLFFTKINTAAWIFGTIFLIGGLLFAWVGVFKNRLHFTLKRGIFPWLAAHLIVFSLVIYPLLGMAFGHRFPWVPTFGLPCPTTLFTLGMLLLADVPIPKSVFIVPLLWSVIGTSAAFQLGVHQDLSLFVAGLLGLGKMVIKGSIF